MAETKTKQAKAPKLSDLRKAVDAATKKLAEAKAAYQAAQRELAEAEKALVQATETSANIRELQTAANKLANYDQRGYMGGRR